MYGKFQDALEKELDDISQSGLYKTERHITSAQKARINVGPREVLNMCANNYLGLADNAEIIEAVKKGLDSRGFGMASVRFICGTQDLHQQLEQKISAFFGTEDTILYTSCFDANTGLFETLLDDKDAIISDALNHASIIDGVRLCKADRYRYAHGDMEALENCLLDAAGEKTRMIATDGVFSMDGDYAKLDEICDLADKYETLVMVDDSHATGFVGPTGRGTAEMHGVQDRVDIITSTPKPDAPVVWGKQVLHIRDDNVLLLQEFFDEDLQPVKRMTGEQIQMMGGRMFPKLWKMQEHDKTDQYTLLRYHRLAFRDDLPDHYFTLNRLKTKQRR